VRILRIDVTTPPQGTTGLPVGASGLPVIELFDDTGARRALLVGETAKTVIERVDALRAGRQRREPP
jgi:hypothetical protein